MEQLTKLNDAANTVKKEVKKEKAVSFTIGKYKLKEMKKLKAKASKKHALPTLSMKDFEAKYGKKLEFTKPFMVRGAGNEMFDNFAAAREKFTADQFSTNEYLEANTMLE